MKENYAKQFQSLSPVGPRLWGNMGEAKIWAKKVEKFKESNFPDVNRLLLSSELFVNRNKLQDRPIIGFLDKFQKTVWNQGRIKIVLVLRNPAERLASSYAQVSVSNPCASQLDFEKYIRKQTKSQNLTYYSLWIEKLFEAFGKDNVCVLLMEDIDKIGFWRELKEFCDLVNFDPDKWLEGTNNSVRNQRKNKLNTWNIRPFDAEYKARTITNNIFGMIWPSHIARNYRSTTYSYFKKIVERIYTRAYPSANSKREVEIVLTEEMKKQVKQHYLPLTQNLSFSLNRDMQALGY